MSYKREKSILFLTHLILLFLILLDSIAAVIDFPTVLLQLGLSIEDRANHQLKRVAIIDLQNKQAGDKSSK